MTERRSGARLAADVMNEVRKAVPAPGSAAERAAFHTLQARLPAMFRDVFSHRRAPRTVVIVPSLSLDREVMERISGVAHYEERLLCLLLLLRLPCTRVMFLSSEAIPPSVIDYYLNLLPGVPSRHARERLTMLSCHDRSLQPLTAKLLQRERLLRRIETAIPDRDAAHMTCFNVSPLERTLAVRLGIPIYGCDPELQHFGSKSGARKLLRDAGVAVPPGHEDLRDADDVAEALVALRTSAPGERAVVKLNEGFSGEGNAVFSFAGAPGDSSLAPWVRARLPRLRFEAQGMSWDAFNEKIDTMGAVVETFIEGTHKRSPSAQFRVDPLGRVHAVSTHDQVLGGNSQQIFLGCCFPADHSYRVQIQATGLRAATVLRDRGVIGRFGVDFVSVREGDAWSHYAIEINLRKGGTTHPFLMLQFLTDGEYDEHSGEFFAPGGRACCYYASDNIESSRYVGLSPDDLIDIAVLNGLHFHGATQQGVVFHMIGALSQFGKLGMVSVADTPAAAQALHERIIETLDRETGGAPPLPEESQARGWWS